MAEDSLQTFRELVSGAAGILLIPMGADEVVSPMTFHFEDMEVALTHDPRGDDHALIYSAPFGRVPPEREAELYREFLDANLFWAGTGGATIGVETATGEAMLCLSVPLAGQTPARVAETAAEMIETALVWRQVLRGDVEKPALPSDEQMIRI
jgi:hypothetical protein